MIKERIAPAPPVEDPVQKPAPAAKPKSERFQWLYYVKGFAFVTVFLVHVVERSFGFSYFANLTYDWPPLGERFSQLTPLTEFGAANLPANILRYFGWNGAQAVQLFFIISGFGLAWGLLAKTGLDKINIREFYSRRGLRLYPMWWGAHIFFVVTFIFTGWGMPISDRLLYISMLGIRVTPDLLYHFTSAWWYFGVMIQLYLVFPILWALLRRFGPGKMLIIACVVTFIARALGIMLLTDYVDPWLRGSFFITQLAAFAFGISLAAWMKRSSKDMDAWLRRRNGVLLGIGMYLLGTAGNFSEIGMVFSPFLRGVGLFIMLYAVFARIIRPGMEETSWPVRALKWLGVHSYALFLMHQPILNLFVPEQIKPETIWRLWPAIIMSFLGAIAGAKLLEVLVDGAQDILGVWRKRSGNMVTLLRVAVIGVALLGLLFGAEFYVSKAAPQGVLGWGEKTSLEPDPELGWRLRPSSVTHLVWDGYDYTVTSNSLGFPGPDYAPEKSANTFRIMVLGDSYSSATGVNTDQAWPRLLESSLATRLPARKIEVLNFSVTRYGPKQYAALAAKYGPIYKPDLIIVGITAEDYQSVFDNIDTIRDDIGFDYPPASSTYALVRFENLEHFVKTRINGPLMEVLNGRPNPFGYSYGAINAFEIRPIDEDKFQGGLIDIFKSIKASADSFGARTLIAMIPASVQVCTPDQLPYFPRSVDLNDTRLYDLELPQRITRQAAEAAGISFLDLRPGLRPSDGACLYQTNNKQWLPAGHRAAADFLTERIIQDGFASFK